MSYDSRQRRAWDYPLCPECESPVFVSGEQTGARMYNYVCHACGTRFYSDYEHAQMKAKA